MPTGRLEAFSDGVIAIIITIMVLDLHVPVGSDFHALKPLTPVLLNYALSFVYLGIYWNNHHHMLHATDGVTGAMLWANLHLLFWLSLVPFATAWMSANHAAAVPTALYGVNLFMAGVAYYILQQTIISSQGPGSLLKAALGNDWKGRYSSPLYVSGIVAAFFSPTLSQALYVLVALFWLVPDRRIERALSKRESS